MSDFFDAVWDPDIPFLRYALLAGALASLSFGIIGSYVVARRITYIAAAIAHSVLGGIGAALYLQHARGYAWCDPLYGAVAVALLSAVAIGLAGLFARQREDTVIGAVWAAGMAVGLLFLHMTPGYQDAMSYLFGDINCISAADLRLIAALDLLVAGLAVLFHNKLVATCFDPEFTELRGVRAKLFYVFLLCLIALTVVSLVRIVGNVMLIALLTLPAALAGQLAGRLWQMMALATASCLLFIGSGIAVSYCYELPSGPVIIVIAAAAYLAAAVLRK